MPPVPRKRSILKLPLRCPRLKKRLQRQQIFTSVRAFGLAAGEFKIGLNMAAALGTVNGMVKSREQSRVDDTRNY